MRYYLILLFLFFFSCESNIESNDSAGESYYETSTSDISKAIGSVLPDPINEAYYTYNRYSYWARYSGKYYRGRFYWPKNKKTRSDLVIIMHRHASSDVYKDYQGLQQHLAKNGFASASIQWPSDHYLYAKNNHLIKDVIKKNLMALYNNSHISSRNYITNNIALIGHSRGGMAVVQFASTIKEYGKNLRSVISLAPGPQKHHLYTSYPLNNISKSYLAIYGIYDDDISGHANKPGGYQTAFTLYDDILNEYPRPGNPVTDMIYLNHDDFGHALAQDTYPYIGTPSNDYGFFDVKKLIIGYCNAYLKLHLTGDRRYNQFFKFQKKMPGTLKKYKILHQHSDSEKRVIANFENNSLKKNTLNGNISFNSSVVANVGPAWEQDPSSPHVTRLMQIYWENVENKETPSVRFDIPGYYRNFSSYRYIAFRASQLRNTRFNTEDKNQNFSIQLESSDKKIENIKLKKYGTIPYTVDKKGGNRLGHPYQIDGGMNTVMIPLSAYKKVDLNNIIRVSLYFNSDKNKKGAILLDNIELFK